MDKKNWYYTVKKESIGPISFEELKSLYKKNEFTEKTRVWSPELGGSWQKLFKYPELLELLKDDKGNDIPACPKVKAEKAEIPKKSPQVKKETLVKNTREVQEDTGDWYWVKHDRLGWAPAHKENENEYLYEDGYTTHKCRMNEVVYPLNRSHLNHLEDDIVMLDDINEGFILHNIRERYSQDKIYTWVGANKSVLISINPFKKLPIYSPETISIHSHPDVHNKKLTPHVYDIAHNAYEDLLLNNENQSILISGESGSGKTECTKQCLQFLAEVAGSDDGVEQKILEANPILEAFGNAKTVRNNNSSRFGKWSETHFDNNGKICGSLIINYLLEKSRVVIQQKNERNYHIFYEFLSKKENRDKYDLGDASEYKYTRVCTEADGIDDELEYDNVMKSMNILGFESDEIDWIKDMIAAVLLLGNLEFDKGEENGLDISIIKNHELINKISKLLGVPASELEKWLTHKEFKPPGVEAIIQPTNPKEAKDNTDAIAKEIYSSLFNWLVERINKSVKGKRGRFIGILDIFGFEIFEKNSFEQLCINYTNEDLQQHFNHSTFTEEEAVYKRENINYEHIKFIDNQPILDIIDKPEGIFFYLNEMRRVPGGNDNKLLNQILNHFSSQSKIIHNSTKPNCFVLNHYAGPVTYDISGFLNKNSDFLLPRLYELLSESKNPRIGMLFPMENIETKRKITICIQFQKQLSDLMTNLKKTYSRYIRCIKPNNDKVSNEFESVMCLEQLTYSGVFEAVKIRKLGYPFRLTHKLFVHRYKCVMINENGKWTKFRSKDVLSQVKEILEKIPDAKEGVMIGNSMCLYKSDIHRILEDARNNKLDTLCPIIQSFIKGVFTRRYMKIIKQSKLERKFNEAIESQEIDQLNEVINIYNEKLGSLASVISIKPNFYREAIQLKKDLQLWLNLSSKLTRLLGKNIDDNYDGIERLVDEAEKIINCPHSVEQENIYKRAKKTLKEYIGHKIEPLAEESIFYLDKEQMLNVKRMCEENNNYRSEKIDEVNRLLRMDEVSFMELEKKKALELQDPIRLKNRTCHIEMKKLENQELTYIWNEYSRFRDASEFSHSSINIFNRKHYYETMKCYSNKGIPTSLLQINDIPIVKQAILCFKCVRGYMGDKKYQYPEQCSYELLQYGYKVKELRDEIYCQILKQLDKNNNHESINKGKELLMLLIQTFLPSADFLPYLIVYFIRENYIHDYISFIHITEYEYDGIIKEIPKLEDVSRMIERFKTNNNNRSRFSVDYTVEHKGEFIPQQPKKVSKVKVNDDDDDDDDDDSRHKMNSKKNSHSKPKHSKSDSSDSEEEKNVRPTPQPRTSGKNKDDVNEEEEEEDIKPKAQVMYNFDGGEKGTISVKKKEIVKILKQDNPDWWKVETDEGKSGFVPKSYLKPI